VKRSTRSNKRVERPPWLRVIDGAKRDGVTATFQDRGARNGTACADPARGPGFLGDLDDDEGLGCLDTDREGNPRWRPHDPDDEGEQGQHRRRNRSRRSECDPGPEHEAFADDLLLDLSRCGCALWLTINPPDDAKTRALHRDLRRLLDDRDADFAIAEDWGKRTNRRHLHGLIYDREPTTFIAALGGLLQKYDVSPETFRMQPLYGWSPYRSGRSAVRLREDLANLAWYATRPPDGDHARLPQIHTSARGIFAGPWRRLMREVGTMTRVRACEACGQALPSGARKAMGVCGNRCRQRRFQRERRERTSVRWPVRLPASYVRKLRFVLAGVSEAVTSDA
jgi:hypothetical protein